MDDPRIDLSPLDPGRDPARLERMVRNVVAAALAGSPRHALARAVVRRGRVAVALAAALTALSWVPALVRGREAPGAAAPDPVALVAAWADRGQVPAGVDPAELLGGNP